MFNKLNDNDVNGNTQAWMADQEREIKQEVLPCQNCDCEVDHLCINCGEIISPSECRNNEGYCVTCADGESMGMKFGGF